MSVAGAPTMQLWRIQIATITFWLLCCVSGAHNITRILSKHNDFSTFNHYLTVTRLATEINQKQTITVLALNNGAMSKLLENHPSVTTISNILRFHVLLDYFGAKKLHQISNGTALAATMFQATGNAPGSTGFVNITDLEGGKVAFGAADNKGNFTSTFVKSLQEIPYNISVIQISQPLFSPEADAPTPSAAELNLTNLLSRNGCQQFVELIRAETALQTFESNLEGGLTVFCPKDEAVKNFMRKYKNLTRHGKISLLLFHGMPYYQSLAMLKSNNGVMNTLATNGRQKFQITVQNDGEDVTLKTKINTGKIEGTVIDVQPQLAAYTLDKVLLPSELFKAEAPVAAPAPAPVADSPKHSKIRKSPSAASSPADSPADGPADDIAADDESGAVRSRCQLSAAATLVGVWFWMNHQI